MSSAYPRPAFALLAALAAAACVLAYAPGLVGPFVFDSVERVVRNEALMMRSFDAGELLRAAFAAQADYPQRGLSYVSFAVNHLLAGGRFDPFAFKLTNLLVHLANGVLVFFLARAIVRRWNSSEPRSRDLSETRVAYTALVAAVLWLLHPIQLTSVLYVVQRMTSLAAFWVFLGAVLFLSGRERLERGAPGAMPRMIVGIVAGSLLGFLCKQNAVLLPFLCAVLELTLFDARSLARGAKRRLLWLYGMTVGVPLLAALAALVVEPGLVRDAYQHRDFGLVERILTEARVLVYYLRLIAVPDLRELALHHDDIATSTGLLDPWTTLPALAVWIVLIPLAVVAGRRRAPWSLALLWFVVGHGLESGIFALELVHEHRNYVPSAGLAVAGAYYAERLAAARGAARPLLLAAALLAASLLAFVTGLRAAYWRDPATLMESLARHHPGSYRAALAYAYNVVPADADLGVRFAAFQRAAALDARAVAPLVEMAKIGAALALALSGANAPQTAPPAGAAPAPQAAPDVGSLRLEADPARLALLLEWLDAEIHHRLAQHAVRTDSVVTLVRVVDCLLSGSAYCAGLAEAIHQWHLAALGNERLQRTDRAVLELSLAKVLVAAGEHERAVEHARRATRIAPENISYRIQAAILYATLERWGALHEALTALRRDAPAGGWGFEEIEELEQRYLQHARDAAQ